MAEETAKRFEEIMKKLSYSPPKLKPSSSNISNRIETLSGRKRPHSSLVGGKIAGCMVGESVSTFSNSAMPVQTPACRPWDRDDFFRRLSTFKAMTWFAKPQVVSPLECAKRGWVNIDSDTIACASCDARLLFSTPSAWKQSQVEKAAAVFSLKLESGHKPLCPWINNSCAEELARFPIISRTGLIENYRKCFFALSNLIALPLISPVAIDNIRNFKLEQFLRESSTSDYQEPLENSRMKLPEHVSETISSDSYYQALKLISLFGWEPHILPYKVEFQDGDNQPIRDANVSVSAGQKAKVDVYSLFTSEAANISRQRELDPNSIALNCNLCGASLGLWAFCTIPQPLEYLRFVGVTEVTGKNVTTTVKVSVPEGSSCCQTSNGDREDVTTISTNSTSSLGVTIAGGLPPAMLNYGATISLPIIGPNLRARLLMEKGFNDNLPIEKIPQVECQSMSLENENSTAEGTADPNCEHITRHPNNCLDSAGEGPFAKDKPVPCSIRESEKLPPAYKSKEFDPIKQHRHFCPWIMSTGKFTPGWQQTLSALVGLKEPDHVPPSTLIEVDDPVASVKRLFLSPY